MSDTKIIKKNYYHRYVECFLAFVVPESKKVLNIDEKNSDWSNDSNTKYEYITAKDVLGNLDDVQSFYTAMSKILEDDGRLVVTQYSALWEPVLRLASMVGLRRPVSEQNWLTLSDLKNMAYLSGFEVVKSGSKMLCPIYIPIISEFFNKILANVYPFSSLGLFHYLVLRKVIRKQSSDTNLPSISIIVPARNEAGTIERIARELPALGPLTEIIFIEGHSSDNTLSEIERVSAFKLQGKKFLKAVQKGKGKGDAVRLGFDMASGNILAIYDADMTVPPQEVAKFYQALCDNRGEFINGSRLVYPVEKGAMRVLNLIGNKFFSLAFSSIIGQPIKDTLCGTKVLWRKDYEEIKSNRGFFGDFDPFGDFDLLFGAVKINRKIIDMPVHYKERVYGTTNINRWKHGWLLLKMTIFASRKLKFI